MAGIGAGEGPTVGGQRPRNNNFMIEGVDDNNKSVTGSLIRTIPNDAVQEFNVLQNQENAEYGHSSGGQFNTILKSALTTAGKWRLIDRNAAKDATPPKQKKFVAGFLTVEQAERLLKVVKGHRFEGEPYWA